MFRSQQGFTLIELIVTMAIFIAVIVITTDAFNMIVTQSSTLMRSADSNIEGMIGLEQFRHDIQQGGFGLPHEFQPFTPAALPQYLEAANAPASNFNDAPSGVPRAFCSGNNLMGVTSPSDETTTYGVISGSDYLVIRGTSVGRSNPSQRWTYLRYSSTNPHPHVWPSAKENIEDGAWTIVLRRSYSNGTYANQLVLDSSRSVDDFLYYSPNYDPTGFEATKFNPTQPNEVYFIYGLDDGEEIRMPFNRTDYFVSRPSTAASMPTTCAENSGILYKTTVNHGNGRLNYVPLVDCVADMQVVYGWDLKNGASAGTDGLIDTHSNADGTTVTGSGSIDEVKGCLGSGAQQTGYPPAAECIRNSLKLIKVYLLVQDGGKDRGYTSPGTFQMYDPGESTLGRDYTLTTPMRNYRWKVYRIVASPKNLLSNQ